MAAQRTQAGGAAQITSPLSLPSRSVHWCNGMGTHAIAAAAATAAAAAAATATTTTAAAAAKVRTRVVRYLKRSVTQNLRPLFGSASYSHDTPLLTARTRIPSHK